LLIALHKVIRLLAKLLVETVPFTKFGTGPDSRLLETLKILSRPSRAICGGI
jgi:hypothetical protein